MHNPRVVGVERAPDLERELTLVRLVRTRDFATASPSRARVRPELELTRRPRVAQRLEAGLHHENEEHRGHVVEKQKIYTAETCAPPSFHPKLALLALLFLLLG